MKNIFLMLLFALCIQQGTAQTVELNVLNYNVMMLQPLIAFPNHQQFFRAKQIPMALQRSGKTWDVVIFSESFESGSRAILKAGMQANGYPFSTEVVDQAGGFSNGGVFIQSRWPIVQTDKIVFVDASGSDKLANKGCVYVQLNKNGTICHVFGTHLQADAGAEKQEVRSKQINQISAFVKQKTQGARERDEPVIISGDFNINALDAEEKKFLTGSLGVLNANFTDPLPGPNSFDPSQNTWAKWRYPGAQAEWLDYILDSRIGLTPSSKNFEVLKFKREDGKEDLSDHEALSAKYVFVPQKHVIMIHNLDKGNQFISKKQYGPNWIWEVVNFSDNKILSKLPDGKISLLTIDDNGNPIAYKENGPNWEWRAVQYADNKVLFNLPNGKYATQTVDKEGNVIRWNEYGPNWEWKVLNYADNKFLLNLTNGKYALQTIDNEGNVVRWNEYGPLWEWKVVNYSDNKVLLSLSNGKYALQTLDNEGNVIRWNEYGPTWEWKVVSYSDNKILLKLSDGSHAIQTIDDAGNIVGWSQFEPFQGKVGFITQK